MRKCCFVPHSHVLSGAEGLLWVRSPLTRWFERSREFMSHREESRASCDDVAICLPRNNLTDSSVMAGPDSAFRGGVTCHPRAQFPFSSPGRRCPKGG